MKKSKILLMIFGVAIIIAFSIKYYELLYIKNNAKIIKIRIQTSDTDSEISFRTSADKSNTIGGSRFVGYDQGYEYYTIAYKEITLYIMSDEQLVYTATVNPGDSIFLKPEIYLKEVSESEH